MAEQDQPLEDSVYDAPSNFAPYVPVAANGDSAAESEPAQPEAEEVPEETTVEPAPEFDPRHRESFTGLLYLGALTDTFPWAGHKFSIRTLNNRELADAARVAAVYKGTDYESKALQNATIAACLISVDGKPLPADLDNRATSDVEARFEYVMEHWFPTTSDVVWNKYWQLEIKVREVLASMGKASGQA